ncbi:Replication factor A protein [Trema orientale]|uniref:Replication factor A protein n=1 Tax=Trema orientale TaxID=63057 RepID=A0A2P5EC20_TREOI|nr:Replication factor A protein [Trema orientale]
MAGHQDMDTSNPAVFVNAELLRLYVGRRVRALIQVIRSENGAVVGKSTDDSQIVVKGSPPRDPTTFVEVIGIADGDKSIRAEIWTNFGDAIECGELKYLLPLLVQFLLDGQTIHIIIISFVSLPMGNSNTCSSEDLRVRIVVMRWDCKQKT